QNVSPLVFSCHTMRARRSPTNGTAKSTHILGTCNRCSWRPPSPSPGGREHEDPANSPRNRWRPKTTKSEVGFRAGHHYKQHSVRNRLRQRRDGRVPIGPLVHVHEKSESGSVMQDENVRVTATLVDHPPVFPAFAYRFDASDRSIVISGDTRPCENLVKLAQKADVLVHS